MYDNKIEMYDNKLKCMITVRNDSFSGYTYPVVVIVMNEYHIAAGIVLKSFPIPSFSTKYRRLEMSVTPSVKLNTMNPSSEADR